MANMNVKFKDLNFKNPVIMASGTFGFGREYNEIYDIEKLGGQCHELLEILVEYLNKEYIDDLVPFYKKLSISYKIKICVAFLFLVIIIVTAVFFIKSSSQADQLSKFKKDANEYIKRDVKNMEIKALDSLLNVCGEYLNDVDDVDLERLMNRLKQKRAERTAITIKIEK